MCTILGPECGLIKGDLLKLLKDDVEVLQVLVPNLAQILELLTHSQTIGTEHMVRLRIFWNMSNCTKNVNNFLQDDNVTKIGTELLMCENEVAATNNWRLAATMLNQLEILPKCFSSDFIYTYFVPRIMTRILTAVITAKILLRLSKNQLNVLIFRDHYQFD